MNRDLWLQYTSKDACPPWICPACKKSNVSLLAKSLVHKETVESRSAHDRVQWDPDWIRYVFTAWAECLHSSCKQVFALSGTGGVSPEYDEDSGSTVWEDYFEPMQCHPMPDIIELPNRCPSDVAHELRSAFSLFWAQPEACAGRIRVALECLMNSLGVPKRKKTTAGKFIELSLHGRIEAFAKNNLHFGGQLMALKWPGNAGSHDSDVSKNDLLDAFEIMEHALSELIGKRSDKVAALAKKLIKKHAR